MHLDKSLKRSALFNSEINLPLLVYLNFLISSFKVPQGTCVSNYESWSSEGNKFKVWDVLEPISKGGK